MVAIPMNQDNALILQERYQLFIGYYTNTPFLMFCMNYLDTFRRWDSQWSCSFLGVNNHGVGQWLGVYDREDCFLNCCLLNWKNRFLNWVGG